MTPTSPSTALLPHRGTGREPVVPARRRRTRERRLRTSREHELLGRYTDARGCIRELIASPGAAGSTLVIDRECLTHEDARLVAHLAADEPPENADLVCRGYLRDAALGHSRCRPLTAEDAKFAPFADPWETDGGCELRAGLGDPVDRLGSRYRLERVQSGLSIPELRWCRQRVESCLATEPVSLREAIASLESYEPVRTLTLHALSLHAHCAEASTAVLAAELTRVQESPIVLNRRLRQFVLAKVERQELSMSEIALRCGRVKRDRRGNESGETSWLARRLGLLPEGGQSTPTPWIHTDVLALIAREGLGVSPLEIEL
jgi:hypothetical protein